MQHQKWGLTAALLTATLSTASLNPGHGVQAARAEEGHHRPVQTLTAAQRTLINKAIVQRDTAIAAAYTAFATSEAQILAPAATTGDLTAAQKTALKAAEQTADKAIRAAIQTYEQTVQQILSGTTPGTMTGVPVSNARASVKNSLIELDFNGALDATTANTATNYTVTINNTAVSVQSASLHGSHEVTLGLPTGALKAGDTVTVSWSGLKDIHGNAVAGSLTTTAK